TVLLEFDRHRDARIANVTANVLLGLIRNPILIGIVTGITLNFLNMPLTGALDTAFSYLQNAVAACSLFALGVSMTKYRIAGQLSQSLTVTALKNLALPVCVYFFCTELFQLSTHWTFVAVLLAAQPTGVNAYIFAERYESAQALATTTVFVSTAVSLITLPVLIYLQSSTLFH
ncbi:MAG: AEC family transporter, partial [Pseudomonadota bacterium]